MLFIVGLLIFVSCQPASPYCINGVTGNDSGACLSITSDAVCCETMSFLVKSITSQGFYNISIHVETNTTLESPINITDFEDLTIRGNSSTILCNRNMSNTGIYFRNTTRLKLLNINIMNCSMLQESSSFDVNATGHPTAPEWVLCAIYILNCTDLTIENTAVSNSRGTGVIVYNTRGLVQILNSNFSNNKVENDSSEVGGGGLVIEFTLCKMQNAEGDNCTRNVMDNANYTIKGCIFDKNQAYQHYSAPVSVHHNKNDSQGLGRGGGLYVAMRGQTSKNTFIIQHCKFVNNIASTWGGGVHLSVLEKAANNSVSIISCEFKNNTCLWYGGGGLMIVLISYREELLDCKVHVKNCNFSENTAGQHGGGTLLACSRKNHLRNRIIFTNDTWIGNRAALGSAVDLTPSFNDVLGNGLLPIPRFTDCTFKSNYITKKETMLHPGIVQTVQKVGTLLISRFAVEMSGIVEFIDNYGSGIYLESGTLTLKPNTTLIIRNNTATFGGGIAFHAFSVLHMSSHNNITLENNTAYITGGAIYVGFKLST